MEEDVRKNAKDVPWSLVKGMRNTLIHEYFGTELGVVWNVIKTDLPVLKTQLNKLHETLIQQQVDNG